MGGSPSDSQNSIDYFCRPWFPLSSWEWAPSAEDEDEDEHT